MEAAWTANEIYLKALLEMGIPKTTAEQALFITENQSAEAAASYVFDNADSDQIPFLSPTNLKNVKQKSDSEDADEHKMVFIVNSALNMGVGKIASQVAHACLALYRKLSDLDYMVPVLDDWENDGEKKIVLKGKNHTHLNELQKIATEKKLQNYLIQDAGRTQIPAHSITVLAIFGDELAVNEVSGDLSLL